MIQHEVQNKQKSYDQGEDIETKVLGEEISWDVGASIVFCFFNDTSNK